MACQYSDNDFCGCHAQAAGSHFSCDPAPPPVVAERRRGWPCLPCCRAAPALPAQDDMLGKKWITVYDSIGNR
jgi:hypothetical protein